MKNSPIILLAIAAALVVSDQSAVWADGATISWRDANKRGMSAANSGDLAAAETLLISAVEQAPPAERNSKDFALVLNNLGAVQLERSKYDAAQHHLTLACRMLHGPDSMDLANAVDNLGRLYWRRAHFVEAEPLLKDSLAMYIRLKSDNASIATHVENLAEFYSQQGEYAKAEEQFRQAIGIREKITPADPVIWMTLKRAAIVCQSERKFSQAIELFEKSKALAPAGEQKALDQEIARTKIGKFPDLHILHPQPGEVFKASPVLVQVQVDDLILSKPEPVFDKKVDGTVGHMHYLLDNHPPIASEARQLMIEGSPAFIKGGEHILWVELVNEIHSPLSPPVRRMVKFVIEH